MIVVMLSINKVMSFGAILMSAKQSAEALRNIIDHALVIDKTDSSGTNQTAATVQFKEVSFSYPTEYKNQV